MLDLVRGELQEDGFNGDIKREGGDRGEIRGRELQKGYICNTMAKTSPTSIRFEPEQLAFIKAREKLDTPQKVVNFLMNAYWWQNKLNAPPITQRSTKDPLTSSDPLINALSAYIADIERAVSVSQLKIIDREFQQDAQLNGQQKEQLKLLAVEKSKTLDF